MLYLQQVLEVQAVRIWSWLATNVYIGRLQCPVVTWSTSKVKLVDKSTHTIPPSGNSLPSPLLYFCYASWTSYAPFLPSSHHLWPRQTHICTPPPPSSSLLVACWPICKPPETCLTTAIRSAKIAFLHFSATLLSDCWSQLQLLTKDYCNSLMTEKTCCSVRSFQCILVPSLVPSIWIFCRKKILDAMS